MKVLYFTKYIRKGASSRMRSYQFHPFLMERGIEIDNSPLFNEQYLEELYGKKGTSKANVFKCYLNRFFTLFTVFKYDKIVIEKELFPYLPAALEWLLAVLNIKYIVDYDDAIFHNYDLSSSKFIKLFLSNKIDRVMKCASLVVAGNNYLAERATKAGAKKIIVIPTVIDSNRYLQKTYSDNGQLTVGWIGTETTFKKHFMMLEESVKRLTKTHPNLYFHIVGVTNNKMFNKQVRFIPWSEATEIEEILKFDVGIMPLLDSPWEKGKCAYKLIQYMACGIPGIASNVGANKEVVDNKNGFLVDTADDFERMIDALVVDKAKLISKSQAALNTVLERFTLEKQQIVWLKILKDL